MALSLISLEDTYLSWLSFPATAVCKSILLSASDGLAKNPHHANDHRRYKTCTATQLSLSQFYIHNVNCNAIHRKIAAARQAVVHHTLVATWKT